MPQVQIHSLKYMHSMATRWESDINMGCKIEKLQGLLRELENNAGMRDQNDEWYLTKPLLTKPLSCYEGTWLLHLSSPLAYHRVYRRTEILSTLRTVRMFLACSTCAEAYTS